MGRRETGAVHPFVDGERTLTVGSRSARTWICVDTQRCDTRATRRGSVLMIGRASEADVSKLPLLQPGVLRLRLHQNRNVGVGVFPEGEKILVRKLCLDLVTRESECST